MPAARQAAAAARLRGATHRAEEWRQVSHHLLTQKRNTGLVIDISV
ncbi:MAG: hypothetical protein ACOY99_03010 [Pseudomonadota bacterium]